MYKLALILFVLVVPFLWKEKIHDKRNAKKLLIIGIIVAGILMAIFVRPG